MALMLAKVQIKVLATVAMLDKAQLKAALAK